MKITIGEEALLKATQEKSNKIVNQTDAAPKVEATITPGEAKSRRDCTLSDEMVKTLIRQMQAELENYHLYRTFAGYFSRNDLPKLEEYWRGRANEENLHHNWIFNYLCECDAVFEYPEVRAINVDIPDHVSPFRMTVDREIETTMGIYRIVDQAAEEGDWLTFNWLHADDKENGRLVKEQLEIWLAA